MAGGTQIVPPHLVSASLRSDGRSARTEAKAMKEMMDTMVTGPRCPWRDGSTFGS